MEDQSIQILAIIIDRVILLRQLTFTDRVAAKQAIASELGKPLAKLTQEQLDTINSIVAETLNKRLIFEQIHAFFNSPLKGMQYV